MSEKSCILCVFRSVCTGLADYSRGRWYTLHNMSGKKFPLWSSLILLVILSIRSIIGLHDARIDPNYIGDLSGRYRYTPVASESIVIFVALSVLYVVCYGKFRLREKGILVNAAIMLATFDIWVLSVMGIGHYARRDVLYPIEVTLAVCGAPLLIFVASGLLAKKLKFRRNRKPRT